MKIDAEGGGGVVVDAGEDAGGKWWVEVGMQNKTRQCRYVS